MDKKKNSGKILALVTGIFSIAIAFIYLALTIILDTRGPMLPPPSEALGVVGAVFFLLTL